MATFGDRNWKSENSYSACIFKKRETLSFPTPVFKRHTGARDLCVCVNMCVCVCVCVLLRGVGMCECVCVQGRATPLPMQIQGGDNCLGNSRPWRAFAFSPSSQSLPRPRLLFWIFLWGVAPLRHGPQTLFCWQVEEEQKNKQRKNTDVGRRGGVVLNKYIK